MSRVLFAAGLLAPIPVAAACTSEQAVTAEQHHDWSEAIRLFTCVAKSNPGDWRPANSIAGDYGMLGRPAEEVRWARRGVALAPNKAAPYINLGNAEAALQHTLAARAAFMKAVQLEPDWSVPAYSLGALADQQQDAAAAERWYRRALVITPDYEDAQVSLAALLGNAGREREAVPILQRVIANNPGAQDARQMLTVMQRRAAETPASSASISSAKHLSRRAN